MNALNTLVNTGVIAVVTVFAGYMLKGQFDDMRRRFEHIDKRFELVDQRFDHLEVRMDKLEARTDRCVTSEQFEGRIGGLERHFESRVGGLENRFESGFGGLDKRLDELNARVERVAGEVAGARGDITRLALALGGAA